MFMRCLEESLDLFSPNAARVTEGRRIGVAVFRDLHYLTLPYLYLSKGENEPPLAEDATSDCPCPPEDY